MRSLVFTCIAVLGIQGCGSLKPREDSSVVRPARLRDLAHRDQDRLEGVDSPRHLRRTVAGVDTTDMGFFSATGEILWAGPARLYHFATGDTPIKWAKLMEDTRSADNRRTGMMELVRNRFARKDPYTKRYTQIGALDRDPLVRAAAIRSLNYSRSKEGMDLFLAGLDDTDAQVRLEAVKALSNIPNDKAVNKLVGLLQKDDNKDVRIASADALRNYKTIDVARALTSVMLDRDFAVAWQARQSLILMTGRDFKYDESAWLGYMASGKNPFI